MINKISYNKSYTPQFCGGANMISGVNAKNATSSIKEGAIMLDTLIKKMVEDLRVKAKDVPPSGTFDVVWSEFENKDKAINATLCLLKISPTGVKGSENNRYLQAAAVKSGNAYGIETVIGYGTTRDIINRLNEQGIEQIIKENLIRISKSL